MPWTVGHGTTHDLETAASQPVQTIVLQKRFHGTVLPLPGAVMHKLAFAVRCLRQYGARGLCLQQTHSSSLQHLNDSNPLQT